MTKEIWKRVPNFSDYSISSLGRLQRLTPQKGTWPGKILKARMNSKRCGNYYQFRIPNNGGAYINLSVARLVAQAFIPNPKNKPEVNHVNGDKANNSVSNLEWTTHKENGEHAGRHGLMPRGSRSGKALLKEVDIPRIRAMRKKGRTFQFICEKFGVSNKCAYDVITGRTWKHV